MELYRRPGQPAWYVDMIDPGTGKRVRRSTRENSKQMARKKAVTMLAKLEREAEDCADGMRPITVADACQEYVDHLRADGRPSAYQVQALRDKLIGLTTGTQRFRLDGARMLHTLEPIELAHLVRARRAEGNGAQTIAHELKMLRAAVRYVAGLSFRVPAMASNPTLRNPWQMPKLTAKTRYLSWDEWQKVYAAMEPDAVIKQVGRSGKALSYRLKAGTKRSQKQDAQDLLVALTLTGGRWAEVATLTWDRIDTKTFAAIRLWGSKGQKERLVPVPLQMQHVLKRRWEARQAAQTLVFPGRHGGTRSGGCRAILRALTA